jgi:hypothetical protein
MNARGFTVVELLVASLLGMLVMAAALTMAASARRSFAVEPAALDAVRRLRESVDVLTGALHGTGRGATIGDGVLSLTSAVPLVRPLAALDLGPGHRFNAIWILHTVDGGAGRLAAAQSGAAGSLTLDRVESPCPATGAVCGFNAGDVAVVFDARGHWDVFRVGAVSESLGRITPDAALSYAYRAGSWVAAARADQFGLVGQPDGSQTLTRITTAGAREPMVDGVVDLEIQVWGRADAPQVRDAASGLGLAQYGLHPPAPGAADPEAIFADGEHCMVGRRSLVPFSRLEDHVAGESSLVPIGLSDLSDGPWCPYEGSPGAYDADLFRLRRIDLKLRVEVQSAEFRGPAGLLFARGGTAERNAPRWVHDRTLLASVALGR